MYLQNTECWPLGAILQVGTSFDILYLYIKRLSSFLLFSILLEECFSIQVLEYKHHAHFTGNLFSVTITNVYIVFSVGKNPSYWGLKVSQTLKNDGSSMAQTKTMCLISACTILTAEYLSQKDVVISTAKVSWYWGVRVCRSHTTFSYYCAKQSAILLCLGSLFLLKSTDFTPSITHLIFFFAM